MKYILQNLRFEFMKIWHKKWSQVSDEEIRQMKIGEAVICEASTNNHDDPIKDRLRFEIYRMESFPRSFNPSLMGGSDLCHKATFRKIEDAISYGEVLEKSYTRQAWDIGQEDRHYIAQQQNLRAEIKKIYE